MFFFFVGGLEQQLKQVVKSGAGRCINCGSKADLVDYEKVLKLFFVPVWRWPGKEQTLHCNNCHLFFPQSFSLPTVTKINSAPPSAAVLGDVKCRFCDRVCEPHFRFCPFCGSSL